MHPPEPEKFQFSGTFHNEQQADYERMEWELTLPFSGYPFQVEDFSNLATLHSSALYHEPGLGKTFTSSITALYRMIVGGADMTIVLMPPVLLANWARFLAKFRRRSGEPLKVTVYAGTPTKRKALKLVGQDFILMSMDIFKRDYDYIVDQVGGRYIHLIVDEAQSVKNIDSINYQAVKEFSASNSLQLLTGTPLNKPIDAYAYINLIAPGTYRNFVQFEGIHVDERDFFDKPKSYRNLPILRQNLLINAARRLKEEVLIDLPPVSISAMSYELHDKHLKLYQKLVNEQLLLLPDGSKIDATTPSKLVHNLGQIVCNWQHFDPAGGKDARSFELVQQILDELGDGKLVVFANYKMTNRRIVEHFQHVNAVGVWGDISPKQKQANLDRFMQDQGCRLVTLQPRSAGVGIDGLQDVCSNIFYFEPPGTPAALDQSLSRLYRDGQRHAVTVRIGMAEGTCQVRQVNALVNNKELIDTLQGSHIDLRAMLFGN